MKTIFLFAAVLVSLNVSGQKGKLYASSWRSEGNAEFNIPSSDNNFYKKGNLYYLISNNNENIFVDILTGDRGEGMRILRDGITVWISMDNKTEKKLGIRYPAGPGKSKVRYRSEDADKKLNTDSGAGGLQSQANTIELIGFTGEEQRRFPADNMDNFRGSVKPDAEGKFHYELIMPMTKLPLRNSREGNGAMPFTLGIEFGQSAAQPDLPAILFWIKNVRLATNK